MSKITITVEDGKVEVVNPSGKTEPDKRDKYLAGIAPHDQFKLQHLLLNKKFYATDLDLCLVTKFPHRGIVAFLDYKKHGDTISFAEAVAYETLLKVAPIFLVYSKDPEFGPFSVVKLTSIEFTVDYLPHGETVLEQGNWKDFEEWERKLRESYK